MKNKKNDRWEISRRFLKHSKLLLSDQVESHQDLILLFLRALNEVFLQNQMRYRENGHVYSLKQGRLCLEEGTESIPTKQGEWVFPLFSLPDTNTTHELLLQESLPVGNKRRYFELMRHHFEAVFRSSSFGEEKTIDTPEPTSDTDTILVEEQDSDFYQRFKVRYRQQKAVILTIEEHLRAREENQIEGTKSLPPELEQEIISLQNLLLQRLEESKTRLREAEISRQEVITFYDELLFDFNRLIQETLVSLNRFPQEEKAGACGILWQTAHNRILTIKNLTEIHLDALRGERHLRVPRENPISVKGLLHKAMEQFAAGNDGKAVQFELTSNLDNPTILGNEDLLVKMTRVLFELLMQFNELCGRESIPKILCNSIGEGCDLKLSIRLRNLLLPTDWQAVFEVPHSLYESVESRYRYFATGIYFIVQTIEKHQGTLSLIPIEDEALEFIFEFPNS